MHNKKNLDIISKAHDNSEKVMAIINQKVEGLRMEVFKAMSSSNKKGAMLVGYFLASFFRKHASTEND